MLTRAALEPGAFLAPHGVAVDDAGMIFVTEFQIGGRVAVLTPQAG
jgi:DNA-binding beta-propeller fold protein YncE